MTALPRRIQSARVMLREPQPADADAVFAGYASQADVLRYLDWPVQQSVADVRRLLSHELHRWLKDSAWVWMMVVTSESAAPSPGTVIGQIELRPLTYPAGSAHALRIGYVLAPAFQGRGLMREAIEAVMTHAFTALPAVWRIEAYCDVDNLSSARLLERVGLHREGVARRAVVHPHVSSEPRDAYLYAVTRDQWAASAQATGVLSAGTDRSR